MVLENLLSTSDEAKVFFKNKKIGYYIGSFDPVHRSHEAVVFNVLSQALCDYVLIYPTWGGDDYKKNKMSVQDRLRLLFLIFKDHPQVIVTSKNPKQLQDFFFSQEIASVLTKDSFIGILGEDNALGLGKACADPLCEQLRRDHLAIYMRGLPIPSQYECHSLGSIMALPVESFVVNLRTRQNLDELDGAIGDRKIIAFTKAEQRSSSEIKKNVHGLRKSFNSLDLKLLISSHPSIYFDFFAHDANLSSQAKEQLSSLQQDLNPIIFKEIFLNDFYDLSFFE